MAQSEDAWADIGGLRQDPCVKSLRGGMTDERKTGPAAKEEAPFFSALVKYTARGADSFHCPGHSSGEAFFRAPIGRAFRDFFGENLLRADICNAVEEMGQLLDHTGAAARAEAAAARVFGGHHLFFVTNGTSTSNKIVWCSQVGPDDIVVVDRNCHKSILHSIMLTGATPIFLLPTRNHHGIIGPIPASEFTPASIRAKIEAHPFIKDKTKKPRILALTQCTYDGVIYNTARIKAMLDGTIDALHFDEAWLSHASFHPLYRQMHSIGGYAPVQTTKSLVFATQSTHKTLAGLSQASQIVVSDAVERPLNRVLFNEAYLMHTSTSPQYSIIASCDVAAAMMDQGRGRRIMEDALSEAFAFRRALASSDLPFHAWGAPDAGPAADLDQSTWLLESQAAWHGFGKLEEGFNMLDPLKITLLNPGLEMDGSFSDQGIPAQITTKFLCEHNVIVEKCGLYSYFVMFTIGITRRRWQTLLDRLHDFNEAYKANARVAEIMPIFAANNPVHAAKGLRTLCDHLHAVYRAHDVARMTTEVYTSPMIPKMRPCEARAKLAHEEVDRVEIDKLEGRTTAVLLTPYPPGIPLLVPGEVINASIVRYLRFVREFNEECAGFETDVHGLVRTSTREGIVYYIDCIREDTSVDTSVKRGISARRSLGGCVGFKSDKVQSSPIKGLQWRSVFLARFLSFTLYVWSCVNIFG